MKKIIPFFILLIAGCSTPSSEDYPNSDSSAPDDEAGLIDSGHNQNNVDGGPGSEAGADGSPNSIPSHCGDPSTPKCSVGASCRSNSDCESQSCNYKNKCIDAPSCINHFGGDTCGSGEAGYATSKHESCCRSLPVPGFSDPSKPGKKVYLDKYEITAGRIRAFVDAVIKEEGKPNFKSWIKKHRPAIWNDAWTAFLPSDYEGDTITISRFLLGDPRHIGQTQEQAGPGVILVPDTDQTVSTGLNYQFNGKIFADLHGTNCGTYAGSYGIPTYYYPSEVLTKIGEIPRADPLNYEGDVIKAQDSLDSKSMNCATNLMFQLLCSFDGGELASNEVIDYVTDSPSNRPVTVSGCGVQFSNHGALLGNITSSSVFTGGRCADAFGGGVNLYFDAGQALPVVGSFLNENHYHYPDLGQSRSDKSWAIASPGRMVKDVVRTVPSDEGWMDLAGNLTEAVLEKSKGAFTGKFSVRGQGVGFGSERSDLNVTYMPNETILRVQRPEAKSGLVGGRCVRFR